MPARTLSAVVASSALAGAVLVAAPSAQAKPLSLKSSYTCATALGEQTLSVTTRMDLPAKVKKGAKVKDRPVRMTVVVPESLVTPMRDVLGITAISGSASLVRYTVGSMKVPMTKVRIPRTDVPDSGSMTLRAQGTAQGFTVKKPGRYTVRIAKTFTFNAKDQNGTTVPSAPFPCAVADGAPTKLGTLRVVR